MPVDTRAAIPQQVGDYDVLSKIAEGGMGAVFKARSRITGEIVAIKVLPPATAKNGPAQEQEHAWLMAGIATNRIAAARNGMASSSL